LLDSEIFTRLNLLATRGKFTELKREIKSLEKSTGCKKITWRRVKDNQVDAAKICLDLDYFKARSLHVIAGREGSKPFVEEAIKRAVKVDYQEGLGRFHYLLAQLSLYDENPSIRLKIPDWIETSSRSLASNHVHDGLLLAMVTRFRYYFETEPDHGEVTSLFIDMDTYIDSLDDGITSTVNFRIARAYYLLNRARFFSRMYAAKSLVWAAFEEARVLAEELKLDRYLTALSWTRLDYLFNAGHFVETLPVILELTRYIPGNDHDSLLTLASYSFRIYRLLGRKEESLDVLNGSFQLLLHETSSVTYHYFFLSLLYQSFTEDGNELIERIAGKYRPEDIKNGQKNIRIYQLACEAMINHARGNIGVSSEIAVEMFDLAKNTVKGKELLLLFNLFGYITIDYLQIASENKKKVLEEKFQLITRELVVEFKVIDQKLLVGKTNLVKARLMLSRQELDKAKVLLNDTLDIFTGLESHSYEKQVKKLLVVLQNRKKEQKTAVEQLEKLEFEELQDIFGSMG